MLRALLLRERAQDHEGRGGRLLAQVRVRVRDRVRDRDRVRVRDRDRDRVRVRVRVRDRVRVRVRVAPDERASHIASGDPRRSSVLDTHVLDDVRGRRRGRGRRRARR